MLFSLKKESVINVSEVKNGKAYRVKDVVVPRWGKEWSAMGPYTFKANNFFVVRIQRNTAYASILYRIKGSNDTFTIYVPSTFEFLPLSDKETDELSLEYRKETEANLEKHLGKNTTSGSDPEIFVVDGKGELIPAFLFLKDKKSNPHVYWDGFQAEFTTTANTCLSFHVDSIQYGLKKLLEAARAYDKKAKLSIKTVFDIPEDVLKKAEAKHVEFGCMPSLNAYNMTGRVANGREVTYRPAGGHIHLGVNGNKHTPEEYAAIVKVLDAIVGVSGVALAQNFDDPRRRELYGLAGEHRLPPHGLEYRVLSNFWLSHPFVTHLVFDLTRKAYFMADKGFDNLWRADEAEVIETINTCNVEQAKKILERNKNVLIKILASSYVIPYASFTNPPGSLKDMETLFNVFMNGIDSVIKDPGDIIGNWCLEGNWVTHSNNDRADVARNLPAILKGKKIA